jgi:vacuolar-type H+-ATPase subunit C/Vma6
MNTEKRKQYMQEYIAKYRDNHHEIQISLTNNDYEVIRRIAEKQEIKVATFIKISAYSQARSLYLFPKELENEIKLAVRNMRGIGNNINQIAKYSNEQGYTSPDSMEVVFNFLRSLENEIKNLKQIIINKK